MTDSWLALSDVLTIDFDDLWSLDCRQLVRIAEHLKWPLIHDDQLKYTLDSSSFGDLGKAYGFVFDSVQKLAPHLLFAFPPFKLTS